MKRATNLPKVSIYADGSCLKNGSLDAQAGAGVVLMTENRRHTKFEARYLGGLTNQKAEILACAAGLESLKLPCRVKIYSDSKYVVEGMLGINRIKANREFWDRLLNAASMHEIQWNWIRGHSGNVFQETADLLSRAAAARKENLDRKLLERFSSMMVTKADEKAIGIICDELQDLIRQKKSPLTSSELPSG